MVSRAALLPKRSVSFRVFVSFSRLTKRIIVAREAFDTCRPVVFSSGLTVRCIPNRFHVRRGGRAREKTEDGGVDCSPHLTFLFRLCFLAHRNTLPFRSRAL